MSGAAKLPADILAFIDSYSRTWNTHDHRQLAVLFAEDADMVMGGVPRVEGREEIGAWWMTYFAGIDPGRRGTFELESARMIARDVWLLNVNTTTAGKGSDGEVLPTRLARGTWILTRNRDDWCIQAMRGNPAVGESRSVPGSDR